MRKQNQKHHILSGVLLAVGLLMIPQAVSAATTARVDTKPENLVHNGDFAITNFSKYYSVFRYLKRCEVCDVNGNQILVDNNNIANGGYDSTAPLPGWSYYIGNNKTRADSSSVVIWSFENSRPESNDKYTTSEETSYLYSNAYYKGDYVYQNVSVEGNRKYNFSCLRASMGGPTYNMHDTTEVVLVELDSDKQVLRTAKTFSDNDIDVQKNGEVMTLTTQFVTSENTAYVQIRFVGDPVLTLKSADVAIDSVYLAAVEQNTQVDYYAGNAENTANGGLIKSDLTNKTAYTLSALSDAEIQAVAPEMCQFTGWKCLENGKIYQNGDSLTLPYVDGETGSMTMVAQWILQSYEMGAKLGDVNQDGKVSAKDAILLTRYIRNAEAMPADMLNICDLNGDGRITVKDAMLLCERIRKGN